MGRGGEGEVGGRGGGRREGVGGGVVGEGEEVEWGVCVGVVGE